MPNKSTRPNTGRSTEPPPSQSFALDGRSRLRLIYSLVSTGWGTVGRDPALWARIDGRRDLVEVRDSAGGRTVLIPRQRFVHFMRAQAGKDWSWSVCERLCVAAFRRPRLLGAQEVH